MGIDEEEAVEAMREANGEAMGKWEYGRVRVLLFEYLSLSTAQDIGMRGLVAEGIFNV